MVDLSYLFAFLEGFRNQVVRKEKEHFESLASQISELKHLIEENAVEAVPHKEKELSQPLKKREPFRHNSSFGISITFLKKRCEGKEKPNFFFLWKNKYVSFKNIFEMRKK